MKKLVPLIAVAIVLYVIYQRSPGLQEKFAGVKDKVTGWSEEAITKNPSGFLDHAESEIKKSLNGLEASKSEIDKTMTELSTKRDENQKKVDTATMLSGQFKTAYKAAEADSSWPVSVQDAEYTKEQLVTQVETLIAQKQSLTTIITGQDGALEKARKAESTLKDQIVKLNGELQSISAKRETIKIDQLTAESEMWLQKINEQVSKSDDIAKVGTDPVRDLDDFVKNEQVKAKGEAEAAAEAAKKQKTIDFLDS